MITVADLKKWLESYPDDFLVVLSSDGEGNQFSPLYAEGAGLYEGGKSVGDVYDQGSEDAPEEARPCLVLWPSN